MRVLDNGLLGSRGHRSEAVHRVPVLGESHAETHRDFRAVYQILNLQHILFDFFLSVCPPTKGLCGRAIYGILGMKSEEFRKTPFPMPETVL